MKQRDLKLFYKVDEALLQGFDQVACSDLTTPRITRNKALQTIQYVSVAYLAKTEELPSNESAILEFHFCTTDKANEFITFYLLKGGKHLEHEVKIGFETTEEYQKFRKFITAKTGFVTLDNGLKAFYIGFFENGSNIFLSGAVLLHNEMINEDTDNKQDSLYRLSVVGKTTGRFEGFADSDLSTVDNRVLEYLGVPVEDSDYFFELETITSTSKITWQSV